MRRGAPDGKLTRGAPTYSSACACLPNDYNYEAGTPAVASVPIISAQVRLVANIDYRTSHNETEAFHRISIMPASVFHADPDSDDCSRLDGDQKESDFS